MLSRVASQARAAVSLIPDADYAVATDDDRIADHCNDIDAPFVMTDPDLPSGSDRALAAAQNIAPECDFVLNLQGDAPFTPVSYISEVSKVLKDSDCDAATPCIQLDWAGLDKLREQKLSTPHSGTTCIMNSDGAAIWFSKNIIPALRNEKNLRKQSEFSPVFQHVGIYGFRRSSLERFTSLPISHHEHLEGLEQLRMLENNMTIRCAIVPPPTIATSGIDTPMDLARVEKLIADMGDPGVVK